MIPIDVNTHLAGDILFEGFLVLTRQVKETLIDIEVVVIIIIILNKSIIRTYLYIFVYQTYRPLKS